MDFARRNLSGQFDSVQGTRPPRVRRRRSSQYDEAVAYTNEVMAAGSDPRYERYKKQRTMPGTAAQAMTQEQIRYDQAERWRHIAFDSVRQIVKDYHWSVIQQKNKDDMAGATKAFAEALVQAFLLGQNARYG